MKITYDKSVDAVSIYISENENIAKTIPLEGLDWMINIDFSESGNLVWLEIIPWSKFLSKEVLDLSEIIG